jgi:hypothetical protein
MHCHVAATPRPLSSPPPLATHPAAAWSQDDLACHIERCVQAAGGARFADRQLLSGCAEAVLGLLHGRTTAHAQRLHSMGFAILKLASAMHVHAGRCLELASAMHAHASRGACFCHPFSRHWQSGCQLVWGLRPAQHGPAQSHRGAGLGRGGMLATSPAEAHRRADGGDLQQPLHGSIIHQLTVRHGHLMTLRQRWGGTRGAGGCGLFFRGGGAARQLL